MALAVSLQVPEGTVIVFDPVTHTAQYLDVRGEETTERQNLSLIFNKTETPADAVSLRPGPLRLSLDNRTDARVLPGVWVTNQALCDLLTRRKPPLTAKRLLTNQTFRDLYRTDTLAIGQRLKIMLPSCRRRITARPSTIDEPPSISMAAAYAEK